MRGKEIKRDKREKGLSLREAARKASDFSHSSFLHRNMERGNLPSTVLVKLASVLYSVLKMNFLFL